MVCVIKHVPLNKENYVPWSSRLLRYAKSKPNGNLIYNSIMNGPYVRRMIPELVQKPSVQNVGNQNGLIVILGIANQNPNWNGNVVAARAEGNANRNNGYQIMCYNCRGLADLDEIEEVNANCILMANLQQASTSGTQTDKAPVYDSDGSAEVQNYENSCNDEIFNMFTQEEQYTELLDPIPEPHQVPQNDSNIISEVFSVEQCGGIVEQHHVTVEETRMYQESLLHNLAAEVEKANTVNRKMKESNAELTTKLARYKNQEKCFEISQEKYDKLKSVHQEIHKIVKDEILPIVNQIDAKVQNFKIQFLKEAAKFVQDFKSLAKEAGESIVKHKALELEIKCLLRAVVITSNLVPATKEPKVVENDKVIAPRMIKIDPYKTSREDKFVPIYNVRANIRTNQITILEPHVITKKVVNSDSNSFSSTRVDVTTKTRRPQPRRNTKNDRVPYASQEVVATACYTQNRSIIRLCLGKKPYELLHDKLPDLSRIIKIHVDFDELTTMASEQSSSGPALYEMTPATISSGLVPNLTFSTPFVPPSRTNCDMLFQPLFDESLTPPPSVDHLAPEVIAKIAKVVVKPT
nr:hypothetical protein [Tanacetum cinerariifolium]